ncbi:MAG TPA: LysM domain-containing protein [Candidatus Limnocylindrales bacterium]|nr:LysM domain-containing protein [Candidatus Limnocylindrales bacterium]
MSERALPSGDRPVACPFVAFVDDRDERASSPDHRHRCYAETSPAPRALAHQEAYCLSSAFPVCPTFQDWARREAARVHAGGAPSAAGQAIPGVAEERPSAAAGDDDDAFEPVYEDRPRRSNQRDWASPPPWLSRTDPDDELGALRADEEPLGPAGSGLGAAASAGAAAGGLSGSFADRLVSPAPDQPRQRTPVWRTGDKWDDEIDETDDEDHAGAQGAPEAAAAAPEIPQRSFRQRERVQGSGERGERRSAAERDRGDRDAFDTGRVAPSWERPARLETYPSLRSRRLPKVAVPSLILGAAAVVLAALLLFFLPGFLGLGGTPSGSSGASPTPTSTSAGGSVAPGSQGPTIGPGSSQTTYTVQGGDTMSKIAKKFGVPLQALIDANKATVRDPNVLKVGDVLIIPAVTPTALPGASSSP